MQGNKDVNNPLYSAKTWKEYKYILVQHSNENIFIFLLA